MGRAVYEQNCQTCHGPELKGDRGPEIDDRREQAGRASNPRHHHERQAEMPAFASLAAAIRDRSDGISDEARRGAARFRAFAAVRPWTRRAPSPIIPRMSQGPPSRYKTGYGNEPYVITPPWTTITAYDLNTGKIKWQTPYGDLPQAGPSDKLRGNVYPKSGFVITAGGLILFAGNDSKLYALDKDTGKLIFSKDLPNGSLGVPAVYEVNGREYILLAVSGGNSYPVGAYIPPGGVTPASRSPRAIWRSRCPPGKKRQRGKNRDLKLVLDCRSSRNGRAGLKPGAG